MSSGAEFVVFAIALTTVAVCGAPPHDKGPDGSLTTQERMYGTGWWPTKGEAAREEYAGEAQCAKCHGDIAAIQHRTPMYRAAAPGGKTAVLMRREGLTFREAGFRYSFQAATSGMDFVVSNGAAPVSKPVAWAFGNAEIGQTYLLRNGDGFIESRLSYYTSLNGLDITTGHSERAPANVEDAFGHVLSTDTAQRCFNCHMTGATAADVFTPEKAVPGVTCEACHGPGAKHAATSDVRQKKTVDTLADLGRMSPAESVDFCGACHRTFADVAVFMPPNLGVVSIRFQPYRLEKSACWGKEGDARITCIACHDPHKPLVRETAAYDSKCLACHSSIAVQKPSASAESCKVGTKNCASCHMPKYEVPQTHASFTDHDIRIVLPGRL